MTAINQDTMRQFGKITIDSDGYVTIPIVIDGTRLDCYQVDSRQIETAADRDFWLSVLREKDKWFTSELEHDFIAATDHILANNHQ